MVGQFFLPLLASWRRSKWVWGERTLRRGHLIKPRNGWTRCSNLYIGGDSLRGATVQTKGNLKARIRIKTSFMFWKKMINREINYVKGHPVELKGPQKCPIASCIIPFHMCIGIRICSSWYIFGAPCTICTFYQTKAELSTLAASCSHFTNFSCQYGPWHNCFITSKPI